MTKPKPPSRGGRPRDPEPTNLRRVTRAALLRFTAIPGSALDRLRGDGLPVNGDNTFDLGGVVRWLVGRLREQRREAARAAPASAALEEWRTHRAARERIALERDEGLLVDRAEVVRFASTAALTVRTRLNALVRQASAALGPTCGSEWTVEEALQPLVDGVLESFARGLDTVPAAEGAATAALEAAREVEAAATESTEATDGREVADLGRVEQDSQTDTNPLPAKGSTTEGRDQ